MPGSPVQSVLDVLDDKQEVDVSESGDNGRKSAPVLIVESSDCVSSSKPSGVETSTGGHFKIDWSKESMILSVLEAPLSLAEEMVSLHHR